MVKYLCEFFFCGPKARPEGLFKVREGSAGTICGDEYPVNGSKIPRFTLFRAIGTLFTGTTCDSIFSAGPEKSRPVALRRATSTPPIAVSHPCAVSAPEVQMRGYLHTGFDPKLQFLPTFWVVRGDLFRRFSAFHGPILVIWGPILVTNVQGTPRDPLTGGNRPKRRLKTKKDRPA